VTVISRTGVVVRRGCSVAAVAAAALACS